MDERHRSARWHARSKAALTALLCVISGFAGYTFVARDAAPPRGATPAVGAGAIEVTATYKDDGTVGEAWWQQLPPNLESQIPPGANCDQLREWLRGRGGLDRGWSEVALTVRARRPTQLRITTLKSRLISSQPPPSGRDLLCVPDPEPYVARQSLLNHDWGFLVDKDGYESHTEADSYIDGIAPPVELGFGEIYQVDLKAYADVCDCTWRIELELEIDGKRHHYMLGNGSSDEPFRTAARPARAGDPATNVVWCAPDGRGRLTSPSKRDCPVPMDYETPIY